MEQDKYFSSLLYSTCEGINCFFSTETQKIICPMVRRKPYLSPLFKKWPFANDFRIETGDGKVLSALYKYCSKVEYNDCMREDSALRWLAWLIQNWLWLNDFFYNLVTLIKLYKIRYLNFAKALLFLRNQVICLKNWKLCQAPTIIKFIIFCWNFAHVFLLNNVYKRVFRIFFFFFRSWVVNKNVKKMSVKTRSFWFLQITLDLNKIKKFQTPFCRHW